ncbi:MAG: ParA family protein [Cyanobacteria bacterium J06649_11]
MAFVISVANAKGGVGKSTVTYSLACYFAERGARIAILDEDIQQSISDIIEMCESRGEEVPIDLINKDDLKSYSDLRANEAYDIIFVDTPPVLTTQLGDIYDVSDMVLIPIKPSANDYNSLMRSIDTLKEAMSRNENLVTAIAINMAVVSSKVQDSFREAFSGEKRIKVLKAELSNRVIHTKYILETYSIFKTSDKAAQREVAALGDEIYYMLTL